MIHEAWVVLHTGHGPMTFVEYLSRVLLVLVGFATIAMITRVCLGLGHVLPLESIVDRDADQDDR